MSDLILHYDPPGPWRQDAACLKVNASLFFPRDTSVKSDVKAAKDVCHRCPVESECLISAISRGETQGIWGGLTRPERTHAARVLGKMRICIQCGTAFHTFRPRVALCSVECRQTAKAESQRRYHEAAAVA